MTFGDFSSTTVVNQLTDVHGKLLANAADKTAALKAHIDAFRSKYKAELSKNLQRVMNVKYVNQPKDASGANAGKSKTWNSDADKWLGVK